MSTVTPIHDRLTEGEVIRHLNVAIDSLAIKNVEYRDENLMLRSWCASLVKRYTAVRVRQMRLVLAGVVIGALGAWVLDGRMAQVLDRALRMVHL